MARGVTDFVKTYLVIAAVLLVFSAIVALVAHASFLYVTTLLFLWGGFAYLLAAILAWTGFANLYRYSPTLFIGSRSYRRQIVRGELWKEGRDDAALLIGLAFGAALMAPGAALWDPWFILVDAVGLVGAGVGLYLRRARTPVRT
ncbi:MAG TPA: hypothetical protein VEY12_12100 [Thermoplasmata archaeon]|nr:hypothetical protein [Thermoplasmata archaeon]